MSARRKRKTTDRVTASKKRTPKGRTAKQTKRKGRSASTARSTRALSPQVLFPKLASAPTGEGEGAFLALAAREKAQIQLRYARFEGPKPGRSTKRGRRAVTSRDPAGLAHMLQGLAHADRIRVMNAIYEGARTHQDLKGAVGLQAGPLYHHLRELERAGLIEPASRNDYRLSETGGLALVLTSGLQAMIAKKGRTAPWQTKRIRTKRP